LLFKTLYGIRTAIADQFCVDGSIGSANATLCLTVFLIENVGNLAQVLCTVGRARPIFGYLPSVGAGCLDYDTKPRIIKISFVPIVMKNIDIFQLWDDSKWRWLLP
jgi:hypothetical protein